MLLLIHRGERVIIAGSERKRHCAAWSRFFSPLINMQSDAVTPRNRRSARTMSQKASLLERYPASEACGCPVCLDYCKRPGWWTVDQAGAALEAGYGHRMMLEMSAGNAFGVLAPAFKGCEGAFASQRFADRGCTFLKNDGCELHATGLQPLECSFCHHDRPGMGAHCHADIARNWNTSTGRKLIVRWSNLTDFWSRLREV